MTRFSTIALAAAFFGTASLAVAQQPPAGVVPGTTLGTPGNPGQYQRGIVVPGQRTPGSTEVIRGGRNEFASEQEAKSHCGTDRVVWANTASKIYHFPGTRDYGRTKEGAYMCERDSESAGFRAAKNEKVPPK